MKRPTAQDTEAAIRGSRWVAEVNLGDRVFRWITAALAATIVLLLAGMALQMLRASGSSAAHFGVGFITGTNWDPNHDTFGALPFIFGTVVSALLGLVIAVPIAVAVAIFLSELAPQWLRGPVGFVVELLAAIPSVVYGLWGIFVLAPWLRTTIEPALAQINRLPYMGPWIETHIPLFTGPAYGNGMLASGIILAIMVLPTIASISRDVLRAAPDTLREGALALGATRWEGIRTTLLPFVRSGLVGAIILGLGRALGETMAVTMVIGNRAEISASLFAPSHTMASVIANEYAEAAGDLHLSALSEIGLLLFGVTLLLNLAARLLVWRVGRLPSGARS